ncbi:hypothetical protein [Haloarchaeobius sp. DFWS5]
MADSVAGAFVIVSLFFLFGMVLARLRRLNSGERDRPETEYTDDSGMRNR